MLLTRLFGSKAKAYCEITAKDVFSKENRASCEKKLSQMKTLDVRGDKSKILKEAAVLVPLCVVDGKPAMLFTVRSLYLKANRGQVAFPGGMADKTDANAEATAVRETYEEVGLSPAAVEIWGRGPEIMRDDMVITPVLGFVGAVDVNGLKLNPDEVSSAFSLPLEHFCNPEHCRTTHFRGPGKLRYRLPLYLGGPEKIWGLTALMTHLMLSVVIPQHYRLDLKPPRVFTQRATHRQAGNSQP